VGTDITGGVILETITNCFKCGAKLPEGSNYCFKCGLKIQNPQSDSIYSKDISKKDSYYYEKASQKFFVYGLSFFKCGEYSKAINNFTKAIELKNDFAEAHYHRGQAYVKESRYDDAINDFTKAIEIDPEFKDAYFQRGNIFFERGFKERARHDYEKIIELDFEIASQVYDKLHNFMESWVNNIVKNRAASPENDFVNDS
jgi:tetratricopeptide (TPR) repeat protein